MCHLTSKLTRAVLCSLLVSAGVADAQQPGRHFPLDHRSPTGKAAHWNVLARPNIYGYPQPVRITVPGAAKVTFFDGAHPEGVTVDAPGQARLPVGYAYRVRISELSNTRASSCILRLRFSIGSIRRPTSSTSTPFRSS